MPSFPCAAACRQIGFVATDRVKVSLQDVATFVRLQTNASMVTSPAHRADREKLAAWQMELATPRDVALESARAMVGCCGAPRSERLVASSSRNEIRVASARHDEVLGQQCISSARSSRCNVPLPGEQAPDVPKTPYVQLMLEQLDSPCAVEEQMVSVDEATPGFEAQLGAWLQLVQQEEAASRGRSYSSSTDPDMPTLIPAQDVVETEDKLVQEIENRKQALPRGDMQAADLLLEEGFELALKEALGSADATADGVAVPNRWSLRTLLQRAVMRGANIAERGE